MRIQSVGLLAALLASLLVVAGCGDMPRDPQDSLERALERGSLRVGVVDNPPWVIERESGPAGGVEGAIAAAFAADLGLSVEWYPGSSEMMFEALRKFEVDLVIGGFSKSNPWSKYVGFTLPYYSGHENVGAKPEDSRVERVDHVLAAPPGENAFIMRLEQFLIRHADSTSVKQLLQEAPRP